MELFLLFACRLVILTIVLCLFLYYSFCSVCSLKELDKGLPKHKDRAKTETSGFI